MENALEKKDQIQKDVAVAILKKFVEKWTYETVEDWKVEDEYPQVLKAIQKGLLVIDNDQIPVYTLVFPLGEKNGQFKLDKIEFRTRIKPFDLANITKGVNVAKQQMEYTLRCVAYIANLESKFILDKFDKFDYKVIEQLATVFI